MRDKHTQLVEHLQLDNDIKSLDLSSNQDESKIKPGSFEVYANGTLIYSRLKELKTLETEEDLVNFSSNENLHVQEPNVILDVS
jgi:hypothetical protein